MSRELKFRAWKKGFDGFRYIGSYDDSERGSNYAVIDNKHIVECYADENYEGDRKEFFEYLKIDCLEQYTGLKDQYGKGIYEGDIIKVAETVKGYVTQDVEGRWIIFGDDRKPIDGYITLGELGKVPELNLRTILATEYCSIIGNIHENPELLRREKMDD